MRNSLKLALAASAFVAFASPAAAAVQSCSLGDITPNAIACSGFYSGNLLSNTSTDIAAQTTALASIGYTFNGDYTTVQLQQNLSGTTTIDFAGLLTGINYIGVHYGNGNGAPTGGQGGTTAFYEIDAGAGLDSFTLNFPASSSVALYTATPGAVPEPATWAMMLLGFGAVGTAMSRRKKAAGALQIA